MSSADFDAPAIPTLRDDLALALRAAAHHGLAEGVCNHFSVELPDGSGRFLLNPRGLLWAEVQGDDIVVVDAQGAVLAGRHRGFPHHADRERPQRCARPVAQGADRKPLRGAARIRICAMRLLMKWR
jgi:hypothetical protein